MRFTLGLLLLGLLIAFLVYVVSGGHVLLLPLLIVFPLAFTFGRRRW
ncbi:MAG: hypothetical protein M3R70_03445 [Actinomycetota bacterium]|nr:hypothetical protein [Actinomycetota bacterium]